MLLDQRVFCGVGNVYRCEVLWAGRAEPVRRASATCPRPTPCGSSTSPPSCCAPTCTTPSGSPCPASRAGLAVYGRTGQPCQRCGETIEARRTAQHARTLYWCPGCQVRLDPRAARRGHADHGPAPGRATLPRRPPLAPHRLTTQAGERRCEVGGGELGESRPSSFGCEPSPSMEGSSRRHGGSDVTTDLVTSQTFRARRFTPWRWPRGRSCSTPCTTGRGRR